MYDDKNDKGDGGIKRSVNATKISSKVAVKHGFILCSDRHHRHGWRDKYDI